MTAVCLKANNSVETCVWSSVFTSFNTDTKSCLFMKRLTSTCISTILYLRNILSDEYFESKSFEGMTLKFLKSKKGDHYIKRIEQWLEGAFDAIEKKYLKRLMLDIQDAESDLTLEIYTMTFNYKNETNMLHSKDSEALALTTKLNTIKLLQMCYAVTQTYSSLPSQVKISMRLSYHDNTPENYQPNGYMAWDAVDPEFPKQPRSIEIGVAGTQYHLVKFLNKSCLNDNFFKGMKKEFENSDSTLPLQAIKNESNFTGEKKTKARRELCFNSKKDNEKVDFDSLKTNAKNSSQKFENQKNALSPKCLAKNKLMVNTKQNLCEKTTKKNIRVLNKLPIKGDLKVRCACLCSDISDTMFPCLGCRFLVHSECFGILKIDGSKKIKFYCHLCHQTENKFKCHDKVIVGLKNSSDQQKLSVLRRVLRYCTFPTVDKITLKRMEKITGTGCPKNVVNVVLSKMIEIGVAIPQGRKKNYLIDKQVLANNLMHYFYKIQNSSQSQSSQVLPYALPTEECTKNQNDSDEFIYNQKSKPSSVLLQEPQAINSQTSLQSFDIFNF